MSTRLNIVVTCTSRKTITPHPSLRISSFTKTDKRADAWTDAVKAVNQSVKPDEKITPLDLYAGEHWKIAKSLTSQIENSRGWEGELWVLSAGYGLLNEKAKIVSYGAAFSSGKVDSIVPNVDVSSKEFRAEWWRKLIKLSTGKEDYPNSLEELGKRDLSSKFLIACSEPYLDAISDDLKSIPDFFNRVFLISSSSLDQDLESCRIKSKNEKKRYADLKKFSYGQLGNQTHGGPFAGSMMSLNVQIGEDVLKNINKHQFDREKLNRHFTDLLEETTRRPSNSRKRPQDDDEVRRDIREYIKIATAKKELKESIEMMDPDSSQKLREFQTLMLETIDFQKAEDQEKLKSKFREWEKKLTIGDRAAHIKVCRELQTYLSDVYQIGETPSPSSALRWYRVVLYKQKEEKAFRKLYKECVQ